MSDDIGCYERRSDRAWKTKSEYESFLDFREIYIMLWDEPSWVMTGFVLHDEYF